MTFTEGSSVSILPSNPDVVLHGVHYWWDFPLNVFICHTVFYIFLIILVWVFFSISASLLNFNFILWIGFFISYSGFCSWEKIILLNSASVILRKSFSPGNVMMGLVISGGAMLPWVVMWSVFAGVWPSEVIMFIKIVGGGGGSGAILSRLPLLFQVERCAEFRSD